MNRKLISIPTCLLIVICLVCSGCAKTNADENTLNADSDIGKDVTSRLVQAWNDKDWDKYISCYVTEAREDFEAFVNNADNRAMHIGLFNVQTASLFEIKQMEITDIMDFISVIKYQQQYADVKIYYCGIDYSVFEENKYFFNGVNYYLIALVYEENEWRIAEMSDAPIEALRPMGIGFNSDEEAAALEKFYERYPEMRP